MDKTTENTTEKTAPVVAISPFFVPSTPSSWNDAKSQSEDERVSKRTPLNWSRFQGAFKDIVAGHDYALLEEALGHARKLTANGVEPSVNAVLISTMNRAGAFSHEKVSWLAQQGHAIQPSLASSEKEHESWANSHSDQAFDWAFSFLSKLPDTPERDQALKIWLDAIVSGHSSYAHGATDITLWVSRRVEAVESTRPGIVREWLSKLPRYDSDEETSKVVEPVRNNLSLFFEHLLAGACPEKLADWLDPGRYGHPKSAHLLMETAVQFSFGNKSRVQMGAAAVWTNFSRALAVRPAAQNFWQKQSRPGKLSPILDSNRPSSYGFTSQEHVFKKIRFGDASYGAKGALKDRQADLLLPMDPLGRLLGSKDDYINHIASTSQGRAMIIESMKSHPAFMAYGFGRFGEDLLRWDEASALNGFRDVYGYGAARYLLATCNHVPSVFDVVLHRCLRQRQEICDEAEPVLNNLFVEPSNRAKFMAMELKKTARTVTKEVPRQAPAAASRRMM